MKKRFFIYLLLFFLIGNNSNTAALEEKQPKINYHQLAVNEYQKGDYKNAEKNVIKAIKANYKDVNNLYLLALIQQSQKNYDTAYKTLRIAKIMDPNNPLVYKLFGDNAVYKGKPAEAIEYYKVGKEKAPKETKANFDIYIKDVIELQNKAFPAKKANLTFDIKLNNKTWELAYFNEDKFSSIAEYGLIGEDVVKYKWTKLVTVNYYKPNTKFDAKKAKMVFLTNIENYAKTTSSKLIIDEISSKNGEYFFKWKITGRNESEVCRVFDHKDGKKYFVHYAHKKADFSKTELSNAIEILKSVKPKN